MILVVAVIWILVMWITVYISWTNQRSKIIEAEGCAATLWWVIDNYLYNALTSKVLKIEWNQTVSPNFYTIQLSWGDFSSSQNCSNSWTLCKEFVLWYSTQPEITNIQPYKTLTIPKVCRQNQARIWFFRSWEKNDIQYIAMNKWFSPMSITDRKVFYLQNNPWFGVNEDIEWNKLLLWEIIVVLCSDKTCSTDSTKKEVAKRTVDARSQTIALHRCKFYKNDENPNVCTDREN